jgi:hypothetical protein
MPEAATEKAAFLIANVAFLGYMSATGRRMCMAACRDARFFPESIVSINSSNAVIVEREARSVMYVRWEGNHKRTRVTWTFDGAVFAKGWRRKAKRRIEEALADHDTPRRVISYRWKLSRLP